MRFQSLQRAPFLLCPRRIHGHRCRLLRSVNALRLFRIRRSQCGGIARRFTLALLLGTAAPLSVATDSASPCRGLNDPAARLRCYDALHDTVDENSQATTVTATPQSSSAGQRVVDSGTRPNKRRWFQLEDGSVWEQVTLRRTDLAIDQTVTVSRGVVGSYHMRREHGAGRSTQVRPVQPD